MQKIVKGNEQNIKNIVVDAVKNLDSLINNCNSESQKTDFLGKIQNKIQEINTDAIKNSSLEEGQKQLILDNVKNLKSNPLDFEKLQNFVNEAKKGLEIDDQKQSPENDNGKNQNDQDETKGVNKAEVLKNQIEKAKNERNEQIANKEKEFDGLTKQHNDLDKKVKNWQDKNKDVNEEECPIASLNKANQKIINDIVKKLESSKDKKNPKQENVSNPQNNKGNIERQQ